MLFPPLSRVSTLLSLFVATAVVLPTGFAPVDAFYDGYNDVTSLDATNFRKFAYTNKKVTLIEFFAPWCGHCKQLVPEFKKAARKLRDIVAVGAVDCDAALNKQLCAAQGVQGFPTIKLFYPKVNKKKPGEFKTIPIDYTGERTANAIAEFATARLPEWTVTTLTSSKSTIARVNIDQFLSDDSEKLPAGTPAGLPKALLFTDKPKTAGIYKALGLKLFGKIRLAVVRDKVLAKRFAIEKFPTLLALPDGVKEVDGATIYDGDLKWTGLYTFLKKHSLSDDKVSTKKSKKKTKPATKEKKKKSAVSEEEAKMNPLVEVRNQEDLDRTCIDNEDPCILAILDPTDPKHDEYLSIMHTIKLNDHNAGGPFRFLWIATENAGLLAEQLDLSNTRPTAVYIDWNRRMYKILSDKFTTRDIERLMRGVISNRLKSEGLALKPLFGASEKEEETEETVMKVEPDDEDEIPENDRDEL